MSDGTPQFGKAEYANQPAATQCENCKKPVGEVYFQVNGAVNCEQCAKWAEFNAGSGGHSHFARGILFGVGGAILGMILYSTVAIVTGLLIGYVSLAVGYLVGIAMKKGSQGRGGRRYQVAAVALTYAAVSLSAIPITISLQAKQLRAQMKATQDAAKRAAQTPPPVASPPGAAADASATPDPSADAAATEVVKAPPPAPKPNFGTALLSLVFIGLASPFLALSDPFHGAIGLLILFIGMRYAWRKMDGVETNVEGPFLSSPVAKP